MEQRRPNVVLVVDDNAANRALAQATLDAGPGVPPALRDRVFERFVQGDAGPRGSRGLGLAFCKLAIEAQGGSIWIEDANPGAVFCIRLDAATESFFLTI